MVATESLTRSIRAPVPRTPLVGRDRELDELCALLLQPDIALVTMTGAGGVGKTRLALHVLTALESAFADGAGFISLASTTDHTLILKEIARAFGLHDAGDRPVIAQLTAALGDRQMLLALDNLEQVVKAGPDLAELVAHCPGLTLLVTSRERLRVGPEQEFPLHPLALPDRSGAMALEELAGVGAVELFVRRARAVRPAFSLTHENASAVAELCTRLDGLPLAIELAAARVNVFSVEALLVRVSQRFQLLTDGARDLPERQQTMWNAVAWSYDLLTAEEQALFRRLSVFSDGFPLEAVVAVAFPTDSSGIDPFAGVASLVAKSLLQEDGRTDATRFVMLETMREFGAMQLDLAGETDASRERHARWFRSLVEEAYPALAGRMDRWWMQRMQVEVANIRKALEWALDYPDAEFAQWMSFKFCWYWYGRGNLDESRHWLTRALACPAPSTPEARSSAAVMAAWVAVEQDDFTGAALLAAEGLELARASGYHLIIAHSLFVQGQLAMVEGAFDLAQRLFEEALYVSEQTEKDSLSPYVFKNLGYLAHRRKDCERSEELFNRALALFREDGNAFGFATVLLNMAKAARDRQDLPRATKLYLDALSLRQEHDDILNIASCFRGLAIVAYLANQAERAIRLLGAESALRTTLGVPEPRSSSWREALAGTRQQVGDEAFERTWREGQALPIAKAIAEAQNAPRELRASPASDHGFNLTTRELQVLQLLAQGHSNPAIAETLFISRRTVTTHITKIYTKLGVNNRVEAASTAHRHGLLERGANEPATQVS